MANKISTALRWRLEYLWYRKIRELPYRRTVRVNRLGLDLTLDLRDNTSRIVWQDNAYEPHLTALLLSEVRSDDVVLDIGAHIGIHALVIAGAAGQVFAFEPASDSAERIERAAADNQITNLTVVRAAVSDQAGELELRADRWLGVKDAGVRSRFAEGPVVQTVPTIRLDDWAADQPRVDMVKLDIEGSELLALRGMRGTLSRLRPRLVVLEMNPVQMQRAGVVERELTDEMALSGYSPAERLADGEVTNVAFRRATGARGGCDAEGPGRGDPGSPRR